MPFLMPLDCVASLPDLALISPDMLLGEWALPVVAWLWVLLPAPLLEPEPLFEPELANAIPLTASAPAATTTYNADLTGV